jgi:hypothetical protein
LKNLKDLLKYLVLILLTTVLLQGCETLETHKKNNSLNDTMQLYRESLRWEEWASVLSLYKPKHDQADVSNDFQPQDLQMLENIKVTDVVKSGININNDQTGAHTSIVIEYHLSNSNKIQKINHPMDWWYNKEYKTWFTSTPLPDF